MVRHYGAGGFAAVSYYWILPGTNVPATVPLQNGFSLDDVDRYLSLDFQRLDIVPRARWHLVRQRAGLRPCVPRNSRLKSGRS